MQALLFLPLSLLLAWATSRTAGTASAFSPDLSVHVRRRSASLLVLQNKHHSCLRSKAPSQHADEEHAATVPPVYDAKTSASFDTYKRDYERSIIDPETFWEDKAYEYLDWERDFESVTAGSLTTGDVSWFQGGKLNVCYNAVDRHVFAGKGDQTAMIWEGDEPSDVLRITYSELLAKVSQIANALKSVGVKKGDVVTIYMPMIPELPATMLACARIGAAHSVVFAGFSADALAARITAARSSVVVTAVSGQRGGKTIPLKAIVDAARAKCDSTNGTAVLVEKVLVWERIADDADVPDAPTFTVHENDVRMEALARRQRPYCPVESMDAEDTLFILYTSGSTGQPKGVVHTTGGYALFAAFTTKTTFDLTDGDIFACVADCGWITGHTYVVYGPLLNGATTFLFESTPLYPDPGRYWDMVERHRITQFYTAPTAIRSLMRYGNTYPAAYAMSSLKILGSVGEPINPAAWQWYYEHVGKEKCTIVDTYWQTETGGHIVTNIPSVTPMKPGSCTLPMYGIDAVVLDPVTGNVLEHTPGTRQEGVLAIRQPWPGMATTCLGDHGRYMSAYLKPYPGFYFTGDSVQQDEDGFFFVTGRVDDVLNVSGHRIGTAEVESALVAHPAVSQAAVVGKAHPIKGEAIVGFVTLDVDHEESAELLIELRNRVRSEIGPFAAPDVLWVTPSLPMTRSGKIMRRILRKIVAGEADSLGDTSTLADPSVVDMLIAKVAANSKTTPS